MANQETEQASCVPGLGPGGAKRNFLCHVLYLHIYWIYFAENCFEK